MFPPHLLCNIFTRLPVKSLLTFRCVSKPVCALIDSPHFIKSHLQKSLDSSSNRTIITASIDASNIYYTDFDLNNTYATFINHPFTNCGSHFLASCNGFILLLTAKSLETCVFETLSQPDPPNLDLVLVNPATRKHKLLPVSPIEYPVYYSKTRCQFVSYGFGHDSVSDDYKIVRIAQFPDLVKNEVKVFSLKKNVWRRVQDFPYVLYATAPGVFLDGVLHWLVNKRSGSEAVVIASFDLGTEKYGSLPQPRYSDMSDFLGTLGVLGGKLCLSCNYDMRYIDFWVMEKYGLKKSWSKILSLEQNVGIRLMQLKAMAYSNSGKEVLLQQDAGRILWYDVELNEISKRFVSPDFWKAHLSLESLVELNCKDSTELAQVKRKTKKSRRLDDFLSKAFNLKL
ncbi:F-box domain-containing protein [Heracleum sosnowskyi]|uniref:F-box domain-containing protein n=1 Tax=Heracleum sosnowskyi TaxID=360622 RepID=A0AAD8N1Q0_9APIA|nr:F-box domain-containing protein [Heracleum sosnowskyi]